MENQIIWLVQDVTVWKWVLIEWTWKLRLFSVNIASEGGDIIIIYYYIYYNIIIINIIITLKLMFILKKNIL